jgi:hypothetical protein
MTEPEDRRLLLEATLRAYEQEFAHLSAVWKDLDAKAQGTVAVAGIFVAATMAFARDPNDQGVAFTGILALTVALLVASVLLAVRAARIERVDAPPQGAQVASLALDLLALAMPDQERPVRMENFYRDQLPAWQRASESYRSVNRTKAHALSVAQGALVSAVVLFAALTLSYLLRG